VTVSTTLDARARQTLGLSHDAIHEAVEQMLTERNASGVLADVGCGTGRLWQRLRGRFSRGIGIDAIRYDGLPADLEFRAADLDADRLPLGDGETDVTVAVETIEHLENPRAFARELARITRAGGLVVITTPNQLSALSLLTLAIRQRYSAFQENTYPAHRTALLEIDLRRIASECGLEQIEVRYTAHGRIPLSASHYPRALSRRLPRLLSDNVVLCARKPLA
jgi:2-polyprenyl-3-methyl-5-hydroxy-6-metoxy-1,4-benzoquinol methylase